jgi:hypothetical protein
MLRWAVLLLVAANGLFFAWSRGWIGDAAGEAAREPARLERQIRPDAVRVLSAPAAAAALAATPACVEAGPFRAAEVGAAEQALGAQLPAGSWSRVPVERPGRWIVYLGRFPNREAMEARRQELAGLRVDAEPLQGQPEHEPGLVLSSHESAAAAEAGLERMAQRGVRNARVLTLATAANDMLLRIERGGPELRAQALALQLPALGTGFSACAGR